MKNIIVVLLVLLAFNVNAQKQCSGNGNPNDLGLIPDANDCQMFIDLQTGESYEWDGVDSWVEHDFNEVTTGEIVLPAGVVSQYEFTRVGDDITSEIKSASQMRDLHEVKGKTYYVNSVTGDNFNNGLTAASPYETIDFTMNRPDLVNMVLESGVYDATGIAINTDNASVKSVNGENSVLANIDESIVWTDNGGGVYSATYSAYYKVLDMSQKDELGAFVPMREAASVADLTPSSYFQDGATLYVHTFDGSEPSKFNTLIMEANVMTPLSGTSTGVYYAENIDFYGRVNLARAGTKYVFVNCRFFYNRIAAANLVTIDGVEAHFYKCTFGHAMSDGVDYNNGAFGYELECFGGYAGYDFSGSDNQISTAHSATGNTTVIRHNCDYMTALGASNQSVLDVNTGTTSIVLGGKFGGVPFNEEGLRSFAIGAGNGLGDGCQMYIEGATIAGGYDDDISANGADIYLKNIKTLNNSLRILNTNGGTVQRY